MTHEAPEFHTKTLSPISPLPVHPPEPENIPILRKQIDPIFNMTTTHLDLSNLPAIADPVPEHTTDSPSSHSSFSSAYAEQPEGVKEQNDNEGADQGTEVSDDYAMTFDSDAEDQADKEEPAKAITEAIVEPDTQSLPILAENPSALEFSTPADLTYAVSDVLKTGQNILQALTHINPPPTHSTSTEIPEARASDEIVAHTTTEPADSASNLHDDAASGGIDIQQLLDNITANAEKNAPPSANATQLASSGALPKSTSSLPTHSSLPPRPNIPQKRPHEDIQKYHAGVPGVPPAATAFRAGATGSLVAAGAPGTSTDPRGGLPPPPAGSFQAPPSGNIGDASYPQINRLSAPGVQTKSIESQDEADDLDAKWGPDVQKIYDQFIDNERMYVTEGLWDRFPVGSRLFIGMFIVHEILYPESNVTTGNLPSEKVTKRDLFHVFHKYGKIAQISIKQAYGFVQFHEASACYNALKREEGSEVRGRKMRKFKTSIDVDFPVLKLQQILKYRSHRRTLAMPKMLVQHRHKDQDLQIVHEEQLDAALTDTMVTEGDQEWVKTNMDDLFGFVTTIAP